MSNRMIQTAVITALVAAVASLAAAAGADASALAPASRTSASDGHHGALAAAYTFDGKQVFPEGLVTDGRYVYSTSFNDGTVYRGRVGGKVMEPFLPAGSDHRTSAAGIRISHHRFLVAGGMTGQFFIYTSTGRLVSTYTVPDADGTPTLVNDAAVAPNGDVYITDSFRPVVYRIPAAEVTAPATGARHTLTSSYDLPDYITGQSNGNGIVATPDGKSLVVGYYQSGMLYRITVATGHVQQIRLTTPVTSADGMLLFGHTLVMARAATNVVAALNLNDNYTHARVTGQYSYRGVDTPTSIAVSRGQLLVTNSQLDTYFYGAPQTSHTFTIGSLPLSELGRH
jgi:sugar lactone lactonase YvrE